MSYLQGQFPIIKTTAIAKNIFDFTIACPEVAARAKAGEFVNIKVDGFFLRRPISICEIDYTKGTIRIVFEIRGEGTQKLAEKKVNENIDIIGPLGKGFSVDKNKKAIVIGGGIGVPPMLETAKQFGNDTTAIIGFRNAAAVILEDNFNANNINTVVCTDDGSYGQKGFVTNALSDYLKDNKADIICACGPTPMLKGIIEIAKEHNIKCEVSLEERMGCGVGACLGCACKTVKGSEEFLSHVCKDGPVFNSEEVVL